MIYECDIDLQRNLDLTGQPNSRSSAEEVAEIIHDHVWPQFYETHVGEEFAQNYKMTDALGNAFRAELARRFGVAGQIGGVDYAGAPFVYRISEIIEDFMRVKHPCLTRRLEPEAKVGAAPHDYAAEVQDDIDGNTSTVQIKQKRASSPQYDEAFRQATQMETIVTERPEAAGEVVQFAHMLNDHIMSHGVPQPHGGLYHLQVGGGKRYEYTFQKFQDLFNAANESGLVR